VSPALYEAGYGSSSRGLRAHRRTPRHDTRNVRARWCRYGHRAHHRFRRARRLLVAATERGSAEWRSATTAQRSRQTCSRSSRLRASYKTRAASCTAGCRPFSHTSTAAKPNLDLPLDIRATAFQRRCGRNCSGFPFGKDALVRGCGQTNRRTESDQGSRAGLREESGGAGDSVPPRRQGRRRPWRVSVGSGAKAGAAREGKSVSLISLVSSSSL